MIGIIFVLALYASFGFCLPASPTPTTLYRTEWEFYQAEESILSRLLADVYKLLDVDLGCTLFLPLIVVSRAFESAVPQIYHARCVM